MEILPEGSIALGGKLSEGRTGLRCLIEEIENEAFERAIRLVKRRSYDLIHNNTLSPIPLKSASLLDVPLLTTLHTPVLPRLASVLEKNRDQHLGYFSNVSRRNAEIWSDILRIPQSVVYNGTVSESKRVRRPAADRKLAWFGRIIPDKGTLDAVRAANILGMPIEIAGPAPEPGYLQRVLTELHSSSSHSSSRYLGHLRPAELGDFLHGCAVALVTPAWDEPFGLTTIEAMANGVPVAAFGRGAIPELLSPETGRIAVKNTPAALAIAIEQCLKLDSGDCRSHVRRNFSLQSMCENYLDLYQSIIGSGFREQGARTADICRRVEARSRNEEIVIDRAA